MDTSSIWYHSTSFKIFGCNRFNPLGVFVSLTSLVMHSLVFECLVLAERDVETRFTKKSNSRCLAALWLRTGKNQHCVLIIEASSWMVNQVN